MPQSGQRKAIAIHGGFVEVLPDCIRVLADLAEFSTEIDLEKARAALKTAMEHLNNQAAAADPAVALAESELAQARVAAAELK